MIDRREAIAAMGVGAAAVNGIAPPSWERFRRWLNDPQQGRFFTDAERATLTMLSDMIIPRDARSGGATDAGSVEYMEFVVSEGSDRTKQAWRDGLRWLDEECGRRFQKPFVQCDDAQRGAVLDDIAWPARARADLQPQVDFFNRARDLTSSAFFSSRMGVEDLRYMGGVFNPDWQGAPPEVLRELGASYDEWDRRYGTLGERSQTRPALPPRPARPSERRGT